MACWNGRRLPKFISPSSQLKAFCQRPGWGGDNFGLFLPKSKELSAFPKSYPLRNRASGGEMDLCLKNAPSELAEAVAIGGSCSALANCAWGNPPRIEAI